MSGKFRELVIECNSQCRGFADSTWALHIFNISNHDHEISKGTNEISKVKCPVLILAGENDIATPGAANDNKEALGDLAQIKWFKETAHCLLIEQKQGFLLEVKEFLNI